MSRHQQHPLVVADVNRQRDGHAGKHNSIIKGTIRSLFMVMWLGRLGTREAFQGVSISALLAFPLPVSRLVHAARGGIPGIGRAVRTALTHDARSGPTRTKVAGDGPASRPIAHRPRQINSSCDTRCLIDGRCARSCYREVSKDCPADS